MDTDMIYDLSNKDESAALYVELAKLMMGKGTVELKIVGSKRTGRQNNALHKYFELLSEELNNAGLDMKKTLRKDADIPWTPDNVKHYIWRPVQQAQLGSDSTTKLSTKDIDKIYDTVNRYLGTTFGVHVPFPSVESNRG